MGPNGGHEHAHGPRPEGYAARPHPEAVVLDIGDDRGALILHADPGLHGVEVEVSRAGAARTGAHKQILERRANGRRLYTAVFDDLPEGRYTFWVGGEPRSEGVEVRAGEVRDLDWRTRRAGGGDSR
ncbi:MAG TPA: hypothetical protein VE817_10285 [Candidatus Acidoferrum sp.]|nr:hypothetical protein [Candidatus Acidoferrum sp.]